QGNQVEMVFPFRLRKTVFECLLGGSVPVGVVKLSIVHHAGDGHLVQNGFQRFEGLIHRILSSCSGGLAVDKRGYVILHGRYQSGLGTYITPLPPRTTPPDQTDRHISSNSTVHASGTSPCSY